MCACVHTSLVYARVRTQLAYIPTYRGLLSSPFFFNCLEMNDTECVAEILTGMSRTVAEHSEEYGAARLLMNMKCLEIPDVKWWPSPYPYVCLRAPVIMLSPWSAASVVPVSTPYFLWHGEWGIL